MRALQKHMHNPDLPISPRKANEKPRMEGPDIDIGYVYGIPIASIHKIQPKILCKGNKNQSPNSHRDECLRERVLTIRKHCSRLYTYSRRYEVKKINR